MKIEIEYTVSNYLNSDTCNFVPKIIIFLEKYIQNYFKNYDLIKLEYNIISNSEMIDYNTKYLNHNYDTDILSFDMSESSNQVFGTFLLSYSQIKENSIIYKTELDMEFSRVMIHGFLHLVGYDDQTEEQRKEIQLEEEKFLNFINIHKL